jgi:hypothetical protein
MMKCGGRRMEGVLFVQELGREEPGNVASAENACARTTLPRHFK